jgi:hypothetical protein
VQGHYCFLTRIEASSDPITFDGWVPFDNNICQKNVQIIASGSSSTGLNAGNRERGYGYGSLTINSSNFPAGASGTVTFGNPGLFQRWQQAGGTVTGGQVVPGTNSIRFNPPTMMSAAQAGTTEVQVVIDRVPFEGEEVGLFTFDITSPSGGEPPTIEITQWVDGQAVGGNVLQPVVFRVYLPVLLRKSPR